MARKKKKRDALAGSDAEVSDLMFEAVPVRKKKRKPGPFDDIPAEASAAPSGVTPRDDLELQGLETAACAPPARDDGGDSGKPGDKAEGTDVGFGPQSQEPSDGPPFSDHGPDPESRKDEGRAERSPPTQAVSDPVSGEGNGSGHGSGNGSADAADSNLPEAERVDAEASSTGPTGDSESTDADEIDIDAVVDGVQQALGADDLAAARAIFDELHISDQARTLDRLRGADRLQAVDLLAADLDPEILTWVGEATREILIERLGPHKFAAALSELETDDAVSILEDLEDEDQAKILASVPSMDRAALEEGLGYPEYSAGRLMQRDLVSVPDHWTVGETIDHLRAADELPDDFYDLFVVDRADRPVGQIPLSRILRSRRPVRIADIMDEEFRTIPVLMDQEEVAALFRKYALVSAAVVDADDRLVGVITVDDVVDVIDEEAEDDLLKLGGVAEANIYDDMLETTKSRFPWLAVNLLTAVAASAVIAIFEGTIEQVVALAVLMPIVASMGGNAGTQTLTVAVRALAMKELTPGNAWRVIGREVGVGLLNGVAFAVVTGILSALWSGDWKIGVLLGIAMVLNLVVAGLAGAVIPFGLSRMKVDPAVSSGVFLTTVTDVVGFFAFLGLAAVFLL